MPVRHYKQYKDAPNFYESCQKANLTSLSLRFYVSGQTMAYCVVSVTPSADPQMSSLHINNIETWTAINDIMAPDEYQALL